MGLGPAYDPSIADHALLGAVLGFDSEGRGLWDDSSYFEGDLSSAYEDVYQERIDLRYLAHRGGGADECTASNVGRSSFWLGRGVRDRCGDGCCRARRLR